MGKTRIEWADATWDPVTGCTPISEGCAHCYAQRMAVRLAARYGYSKDFPFRVTLHKGTMQAPFKWRTPRRVFVCSMGDLFHEDVPPSALVNMWGVMKWASRHTFLVLTKRPERMYRFVSTLFDPSRTCGPGEPGNVVLPNVWLGVSVENQRCADERLPTLLQTPAAKRFVSCEPLLDWVDLRISGQGVRKLRGNDPDWVICGGETGPGARPLHPNWVRALRDQCIAAGVPFFFKSWGEWTTEYPQGLSLTNREMTYEHGVTFYRVGKKFAGRVLDGREWNEMPEVIRDEQ